MTSQSEPSSASSKTSGRLTLAPADAVLDQPGNPLYQGYQRKVSVTMTRNEAELARAIFMAVATDIRLADRFGLPKGIMKRARSLWRKTDRRITKRDEAQRRKYILKSGAPDEPEPEKVSDLGDRPFLELEE